jgi:5-hydroxyisourate hydrolase
MSSLSTHVLDTMHGRPAIGMALLLNGPNGVIASGLTNSDGRCPEIAQQNLAPGLYSIDFGVCDYFVSQGVVLPTPPFLDVVTVDFGIAADGGHYHVPLLVSPYGYSTYRGS